MTRQRDAGDATLAAWLRADPAYVQPDINGARLLAYGDALALAAGDLAGALFAQVVDFEALHPGQGGAFGFFAGGAVQAQGQGDVIKRR